MDRPDIRPFQAQDWPQLWPILQKTIVAGDTYAFSPDSSEDQIYQAWIELPTTTYVAVANTEIILGSYFIKPNQPGLGNHVCNCGYVVAEHARGRGIATLLCENSQSQAKNMGFKAMQFNFVVATNTTAVTLWQRLGLEIIGTIPKAFRHHRHGLVAAHIMYKELTDSRCT